MATRSVTEARALAYDAVVADEELTKAISLRISEDDMVLLETVSARLPMIKKLAIARQALRLGLAEIAKDPSALFRLPPPAPKSEPKPKPKR